MGRLRTFDHDEVVRSARDLFWSRGYAEAGIGELEEATSLKRSSLYHAFGSKRGLFEAVVVDYLAHVARPRLAGLRESNPAPEALERYLAVLRAEILSPSSAARSGCLLLNAACTPLASDDDGVRAIIAEYTEEIRVAVRAGVAAGRPDLDAASQRTLAVTCSSLVLAALAQARTDEAGAAESLDAATSVLATWQPRAAQASVTAVP